jgi:hypothetical protein
MVGLAGHYKKQGLSVPVRSVSPFSDPSGNPAHHSRSGGTRLATDQHGPNDPCVLVGDRDRRAVITIAMISVWEDFADYDNDFFMLFPLKGYDISLSIWPENGRFFPFSMQEFNLIRHFRNTPIGDYLLPIAQLLVFFCILLILDADLSITARAGLAILASVTAAFSSILADFCTRSATLCFSWSVSC